MNKFYIYLHPSYGLFHTFNELDLIFNEPDEHNRIRIPYEGNFEFTFDNNLFVYRRADWYYDNDKELESDGVHVVKTQMLGQYSDRDTRLIQRYKNKGVKILFIGGNLEQFIFSNNSVDEQMWINLISESNNLFLIHNVPLINQPNTLFTPKTAVIDYVMMGREGFHHWFIDIFYAFKDIFPKVKKDYRIGFHIGGLVNKTQDREFLTERLMECGVIGMDKFYFTFSSKRDIERHRILCERYGIDYDRYMLKDNSKMEADLSLNWEKRHNYIPINYATGLSLNSLRSDIELVYETNLQEASILYKKITEKTLKLIMLGKPFLHIDPIFYSLIKKYGFTTYDCLYGEELTSLALTYQPVLYSDKTLSTKDISLWMPLFAKRVEYLMNLDDKDWFVLMRECSYISQLNMNKWKDLFYNGSLYSLIKDNPNVYKNLWD